MATGDCYYARSRTISPINVLGYAGIWNPSGGSYPSSTYLSPGQFFVVTADGVVNGVTYSAGDWIIYNGVSFDVCTNIIEGGLGFTPEDSANKGQANGYTALVNGVVPSSQLPAVATGALSYQGTWDASSGAYPTATATGQYWIVSVAGTVSGISYSQGDWAIYSSASGWEKAAAVSSNIGMKAISFTQATPSPTTIFIPPATAVITKVVVCVDTPASATGASISVGISGSPAQDFNANDCDLTTIGTYIYEPYTAVGSSPSAEIITIKPASQTFAGRVYLFYQVPA